MSRDPTLQMFHITSQDGVPFTLIIDTVHIKKGSIVITVATEEQDRREEYAEVVIETETEPNMTRVLARIWSDNTPKEGDATKVITLIEVPHAHAPVTTEPAKLNTEKKEG
jgi:hypothetical protein